MTTPTMNKLRELEAKIKGLPDQKALARRRQIFQSTHQEALQRQLEIDQVTNQLRVLRKVRAAPSLLAAVEDRKISVSRAKASEILIIIGNSKSEPDGAKLSEKLDAIKRTVKSLADEARSAWELLCQEQRDYASALRPLAERLSPKLLQRVRELSLLVDSEKSHLPASMDVADRLIISRRMLDEEVAALNLDAPIVKFIQEAQAGNADPKSLFDPQVRQYLDDNPALWKSLRVALI